MRICWTLAYLVILMGLHLAMATSSEPITALEQRELENRIVGGTIAKTDRFPYFTSVVSTDQDGYYYLCGGTLIAPDVVMTAAHCLEAEDSSGCEIPIVSVDVFVNSTNVKSSKNRYNRKGIKWIMHPGRDTLTLSNDIALIFLNSPVLDVRPVNINKEASIPVANNPSSLTVVGLGDIAINLQNVTVPAVQLNSLTVKPITMESCKNAYPTADASLIGLSNICTTSGAGVKKDTCSGDGGGPLLMQKGSAAEDIQLGIVSWSNSVYCNNAYPAVFTRVSYFAAWVDGQVCKYSVRKPSTCSTLKPTSQKPNTQKPTTKKPTSKKPTTQKPNTKNPTTVKPTTRKPTIKSVA